MRETQGERWRRGRDRVHLRRRRSDGSKNYARPSATSRREPCHCSQSSRRPLPSTGRPSAGYRCRSRSASCLSVFVPFVFKLDCQCWSPSPPLNANGGLGAPPDEEETLVRQHGVALLLGHGSSRAHRSAGRRERHLGLGIVFTGPGTSGG